MGAPLGLQGHLRLGGDYRILIEDSRGSFGFRVHTYCGWRKSCTTYIVSIFNDVTTNPCNPFLTLTTVLSERCKISVIGTNFVSGGFQCQC